MHKLDRTRIAEPECLKTYDHKTQTWDDFGGECKRQTRFALAQMQGIPGITTEEADEHGVRCAYCEGPIFYAGHIEHFCRKHPDYFPELCFSWHNLFLACGADDHCGHYKDRKGAPAYDPAELIKPDQHDPEHYLYFHSSGEVRVRDKLNPEDSHRADATIRVFGLNNPPVVGARTRALASYRKKDGKQEELDELMSWSEADRNAYLEAEIAATRWDPYATTIKNFLQKSS